MVEAACNNVEQTKPLGDRTYAAPGQLVYLNDDKGTLQEQKYQ